MHRNHHHRHVVYRNGVVTMLKVVKPELLEQFGFKKHIYSFTTSWTIDIQNDDASSAMAAVYSTDYAFRSIAKAYELVLSYGWDDNTPGDTVEFPADLIYDLISAGVVVKIGSRREVA